MRRGSFALAVGVLALAGRAAYAEGEPPEQPPEPPRTPRTVSFEFSVAPYLPNIDSEFGGTRTPYRAVFGDGLRLQYRFGASKSWYLGGGTLDAGVRVGWFSAGGHGIIASSAGTANPVSSQDPTGFNIFPTSAGLGYRLDFLPERLRIPIAPYGRVNLERYNWWVTGGSGGTVARGATNGWSATVGLAFLLDWVDPDIARDFEHDEGVRHTYLTADVSKTSIDDFGSKTSWDLSNSRPMLSFGFVLVF